VDELKRAAQYRRAADELRGWFFRWSVDLSGDLDAESRRMNELMLQMVELEELVQRADEHPRAARAYLERVTTLASPTTKTVEQARGLLLVAKHDPEVRRLLDAAFPARVVVEARGETVDDDLFAFPFESALVEMSRGGLVVVRGDHAGASTLRVRVIVKENNRDNSNLAGTSMRSYGTFMTAVLEGADGQELSSVATTTSLLGINPGFAARHGADRAAALLYEALVDDIAKRALLDD
jgi:hypothetical protein